MRHFWTKALALAMIGAMAASPVLAEEGTTTAMGGKLYIEGFEWGPGATRVVVELDEAVSAVDAASAVVTTNEVERVVTDAYLSDDAGEPVEGDSACVTFTLETTNAVSGNPFNYDFAVTGHNLWSEAYPFTAQFTATAGGEEKAFTMSADAGNKTNIISPDTDVFTVSDGMTGEYENPLTGETDSITILYKAYEPDALKEDEVKNPLVIWLHGAGEGGDDVDISLLGNEVVALSKDPIQSYFTSEGGANGAYVAAFQCATMWMDAGDNGQGAGDKPSRYTQALKDAIDQYIASNEDIDVNRIYVGGCSNGGYMTMNMLFEYPDFFAAAYPICEAYAFYELAKDEEGNYTEGFTDVRFVTDEKIQSIKDIPIWFVHSANDTTVVPADFSLPTYKALLDAGAENAWFSYFETVQGFDDPDAESIVNFETFETAPGYIGHWSWTYAFNDKVTGVQDVEAIKASTDTETFGFTPTNDGGGTELAAGEYDNLFKWMNAQSK